MHNYVNFERSQLRQKSTFFDALIAQLNTNKLSKQKDGLTTPPKGGGESEPMSHASIKIITTVPILSRH